ncbi:MAG: hypothetical protein ACKO5Q_28110 [Microcystaceae cyanobacterium]
MGLSLLPSQGHGNQTGNPLDLLILPSGQGIIKNPQGVRKSLTRTAWHGRKGAIAFSP